MSTLDDFKTAKIVQLHALICETHFDLTLRWPGFSNFSQKWEELFLQTKFCRLILGTSAHEKMFQIGPTILALKLDKGGGCWGWQPPPPH